ncbi:MAG: hypothetical protein NC092_14155 [Butyrivibrio sp.]|nr:hypothetical protein [Muribaculum sp.]MCM1553812.1 hypothetical protein [Butyrivibrio sp.]
MDIVENKQAIMKNRCKSLGTCLRILFWLYILTSLAVLMYWGISALLAPETAYTVEQFGNDAKVGFTVNGRGLYLMVTDTSFHLQDYSCKALYGIIWFIDWGYQALTAAILWCLYSILHHIELGESPFTLFCCRVVRSIGLLLLGIFMYKNIVETLVLFIWGPPTARLSWGSNLELVLIGGVVLCLGYIFEYGVILQQQSDETL